MMSLVVGSGQVMHPQSRQAGLGWAGLGWAGLGLAELGLCGAVGVKNRRKFLAASLEKTA